MTEAVTARRRFLRLFPSIGLPIFLAFLEQTIVAVALPAMAADFGDLARVAWVIVVYLAAVAIAAPLYGRLGDAYGRRRLLLIALTISAVGAFCCSIAGSVEMLIAARIGQGLGAGGLMTMTQALISESVGARDRARYQGYLAVTAVIATGLGPIIGGFLTGSFGWRSIFVFYLPLIAIALLLARRLPVNREAAAPLRFDVVGIGLVALSIGALLVAIELLRRSLDAPTAGLALLGLSIVGFAVLAWWEHRAEDPLISPTLVRDPVIWRGCLLAMCQGSALLSLLSFVPILMRVSFAAEPTEIGLLMVPMSVCLGLGAWGTGQLVSRTGRTALFPMLGLSTAAILLCGLALFLHGFSPWGLALYLSAIAASLGMIMAVVLVIVPASAGPRHFGAASAIVQLARSIGSAVGTALTSSVIVVVATAGNPDVSRQLQSVMQGGENGQHLDTLVQAAFGRGFSAAFLVLAAITLLGAFVAWRLPVRRL